MKKALLAAIAVLLLVSAALAADWDVARVTQMGKQLTIHVTKTPQKAYNFKITNVRGEKVGSLYGYKGDMLIFEGDWDAIVRQRFAGLYLDGDGHRRPLFKPVSGAIWEDGYSQYVYPLSLDMKTKRYILNEPNSVKWNRYVKPNDVTVIPKRLIHTYSEQEDTTIIPRGTDGSGIILRDGTTTVIQKDNHTIVLRNGTPTTVTRPDGTKVLGPGRHIVIEGSSSPGPDASVGEGCECGDGEKAEAGGKAIGSAPGPGKGEESGPTAPEEGPPGDVLGLGPGAGPGPPPGEGNTPGAPVDGPAAKGAAPGPGGPGPGGPGTPATGPGPNGLGIGPTPGPGTQPQLGAQPPGNKEQTPAFVLYVATGDSDSGETGKVYQVNEHGRILGWISVSSAPTGIALHRDNGLVVALPRNGGKIIRINEAGKQNVLLEKQTTLVHPVDVGIGGGSDSILVADNIGDVIVATSIGGIKPKVYERFEGQKWTAQNMSVAVTSDKHGVWGDDTGIFRGESRVLPGVGGVAADPASLKWAATQTPNQIYVLEGEELQRKLRLPPGKSLYNQGILSFGPAGSLAVAARDGDAAVAQPWFLLYDDETDDIRSLFQWEKERVNDFVIGPRMLWDNAKETAKPKGIY